MTVDATTQELIDDCLARIATGDAGAVFDLASVHMSHADAKDVSLNLAVIEALVTIAKLQGSVEAEGFLAEQWPKLKVMLGKRWQRAGFT